MSPDLGEVGFGALGLGEHWIAQPRGMGQSDPMSPNLGEAGSDALGLSDDDSGGGDDGFLGMEAATVVTPWYVGDINENDVKCLGA